MKALQIDSDAPDVTLKSPEVRMEPVAGKRFGLFSKVLQADIFVSSYQFCSKYQKSAVHR
jgi:hypothetical protein